MIKETGEFVINLTTEELAYATDYCGVKSGKDEDKFKNASLTKEPAKYVKAPLIKESPCLLYTSYHPNQSMKQPSAPSVIE